MGEITSGLAFEKWQELTVALAPVLQQTDRSALLLHCRTWERWALAEADIEAP